MAPPPKLAARARASLAAARAVAASSSAAASLDAVASPERRGIRREAAFRLWLANLALGTLLGSNWLVHLPEVDSLRLWLFASAALVSSVLTLTLLPGLACQLAAHLSPRVRLLGFVQAFGWTLFQVLLFADTRLYNMFRYHFNGQVLNLVYTRGSEDSIHLGWQVWSAIAAGFVGVGSLQYLLWQRALRQAERRRSTNQPGHLLLRPAIVFGTVLLPTVFVEKTIYAQADFTRDREITALAKLFPLYARVPMEDLASKVLGVEVVKPPAVELEGVALNYPRTTPELPALELAGATARPNVLVLVIDCLRQDALAPETMPNVTRWAEGARVFEDHVAGGNSTRYGIFSMLYSLPGSYWFPMLQERRGPVLVDALQEAGYTFGVFGAASMNYPELRDTAWSAIPGSVQDAFKAPTAWQRDRLAAGALVEWLEEVAARPERSPFFGFALLDSAHQTYSYPEQLGRFQPAAPDMDYLAMTRNEGPEPAVLESVVNRYRNAVLHADLVSGAVLATLERLGLAEDTIVVVTGDHGEEFRENGFIGHTSAFTAEQVAVPFVVKGPGFAPGRETRPTSHLDFAPTLLELFGADANQRSDWALGENLLDPPAERKRILSGWNELGVWLDEAIVRVPLTLFDFDVEVYDHDWNLVLDDSDILTREHDTLVELGRACNRFLR